ncbi:hypothetical protein Mgrana_02381 [Meiothermus granaticius NBRC 107808]|uniref:Uncharacterized protein n=1 Tax=Meiothermus granaticius NBRC 107808 TaxID=1227551 RepID=A0A399F7K9_9DEIN|nr:hypothetical protein Mgrana_02381 [Meiothermus granaticius NBRC 107808]
MNIVQQFEAISKEVGMRKTQAQYLVMLVGLWLAIPGRVNYLWILSGSIRACWNRGGQRLKDSGCWA